MGNLLVFSENDMLGHVTHVDTEQIIIEIENSNLMNKICVGNLVAIETSKQHENLIALIDKVTRKYMETYMDEDNEIDEMMASSTDYIKVSVIGTYFLYTVLYMICLKEVLKLFRKLKVNVMRL